MSDSVRVCKEWFPNLEHPEDSGFLMNEQLKTQIDVLLKNIKRDWDFTLIITGQGEVRVGKSMISMQIACYWNYMIWKLYGIKNPFSVEENFVFEGSKLIEIGNKLGKNNPYSTLIYDEAGADLEGRKVIQSSTQAVLDYYRECGQYNMLNILVLPEFFDLPKGLALSRSIFLIDVYYSSDSEGIFKRGYFNFFSRRQKKWLYLLGKRDLNYSAAKYDFNGKFPNFYTIKEDEYRLAKQEALSKRESKKRNKFQMQRDASWFLLWSEFKLKQEDIGKRMEGLTGIFVPQQTISDALRHYKMENE
jgi:hypothetical protein